VFFILFLAGSVLVHELRNVSAMIRKILYSRLLQVSLRHLCSSLGTILGLLSLYVHFSLYSLCVCVSVSVSLSLSSRTCSLCSREVHLTAVSLAASSHCRFVALSCEFCFSALMPSENHLSGIHDGVPTN
jgi:hypothetical protein